jgi:hypothetical protein
MLRPKPRVTGGTTALTAYVSRKPPLPSLGSWGGSSPSPPFGNSELLGFSFPIELILNNNKTIIRKTRGKFYETFMKTHPLRRLGGVIRAIASSEFPPPKNMGVLMPAVKLRCLRQNLKVLA